jgi:hypothetical protein
MLGLRYITLDTVNSAIGVITQCISEVDCTTVFPSLVLLAGFSQRIKLKKSRYRSGGGPEGPRKLKFPDFVTTA